jgi:hypothetical protein
MTRTGNDTDTGNGTGVSTWNRAVIQARRMQLARLSLVGLVMLLLGVGIGRWSVPDGDPELRTSVERTVQPLALDADAIWTSSVGPDRPPVAESIPMVRRGEQLEQVREWTVEWLEAYDGLLVRLTGLDLAPEARPVQRHFVSAVTLSRDAVDVLRQATVVEDAETREALVAEALRLRQRAEHLAQSASAAIRDLDGGDGEVSQHPELPAFGDVQGG